MKYRSTFGPSFWEPVEFREDQQYPDTRPEIEAAAWQAELDAARPRAQRGPLWWFLRGIH